MPMLQFDLDELFENLIPPEKLQKLKSSSGVHQIKLGGVGGEPKQTQKTSGIQTPPLTPPCPPSPPVESNKPHDESLSELSTEDKELILSVENWVTHCQPGDEWEMPNAWLPDSDELRHAADERVRLRNSKLRIWRTGKTHLVCKVWFGPEPPPYKKYSQETHRFRRNDQERIRTMWSPEEGWMEWNPSKDDYVAMSQVSESRQ